MTRIAIVEPEWSGGNWWGVAETPWAKQKGPPHPQLTMVVGPVNVPEFHAESVPPADLRTIRVTFGRMTLNSRSLWMAMVDGDHEAVRLLNIAYTCPDTHVHWKPAKEMRDRFERMLANH